MGSLDNINGKPKTATTTTTTTTTKWINELLKDSIIYIYIYIYIYLIGISRFTAPVPHPPNVSANLKSYFLKYLV